MFLGHPLGDNLRNDAPKITAKDVMLGSVVSSIVVLFKQTEISIQAFGVTGSSKLNIYC